MVNETGKIFHDNDIRVTATCIRVPVLRAHCEDLNIEFRSPASAQAVRDALAGGTLPTFMLAIFFSLPSVLCSQHLA